MFICLSWNKTRNPNLQYTTIFLFPNLLSLRAYAKVKTWPKRRLFCFRWQCIFKLPLDIRGTRRWEWSTISSRRFEKKSVQLEKEESRHCQLPNRWAVGVSEGHKGWLGRIQGKTRGGWSPPLSASSLRWAVFTSKALHFLLRSN